MIIGLPREVKSDENRVALLPVGVEALVERGHTVRVEREAGVASGVPDAEYRLAGATLVDHPDDVYSEAALVVKVKEPQPDEIARLRPDLTLFCYFHFAASEELTQSVLNSRATAVAYETVELESGGLPLLLPMSEVAGRMAVQEGAKYLESPQGGRGILLAGVTGVAPGDVVILGGGVVGSNAARIAAGLGANVFILDIDLERLRYLDDVMPANVTTLMSNRYNLDKLVRSADLVIGAVLRAGAKAPKLITRQMVRDMKEGSVIVDVAIDQGGAAETSRPTTHSRPTYKVDGVSHYCVANIPGAVPRTSTFALTNATLPYVLNLADQGWRKAARNSSGMARGINTVDGKVTHPGVAEAWNLDCAPIEEWLHD